MLAPLVVVLSVTVTEPAQLPPAGLKLGGATDCWIVYVALVTLLLVIPLAAAIALSVVVVVTGTGPENGRAACRERLSMFVVSMLVTHDDVLIVTSNVPSILTTAGT